MQYETSSVSTNYPFCRWYEIEIKKRRNIFLVGEEIRFRFMQKRESFLPGALINPWTIPFFWDYFVPTLTCPFLIERVGGIGDGGKLVCGLEEIATKPSCVVYSFGVGGDSSFEKEVLDRTNCSIFAFDPTVPAMRLNLESNLNYKRRVTFEKIWIGPGDRPNSNFPVKTISELMQQNGHSWIDMVKMDIEGSEYAALLKLLEDFQQSRTIPISHLNLEIHLQSFKNITGPELKKLEGQEFQNVYNFFQALEGAGLRAFVSETNHLPCVWGSKKPDAVEYSFLNIAPFLPDW